MQLHLILIFSSTEQFYIRYLPMFLYSVFIVIKYTFMWAYDFLSLDIEVVIISSVIKWVTVVSPYGLCLGPRKIIRGCCQFQGSVKSLRGSSLAVNLLLPQHSPWGFPTFIPYPHPGHSMLFKVFLSTTCGMCSPWGEFCKLKKKNSPSHYNSSANILAPVV